MGGEPESASEPVAKRGRPRSTARHHAILDSTRALLSTGSYDQLTMEAIAGRAGVSKQTVYNWWPSKAAVVAEAIVAGYMTVVADPPPSTGDLRADLGVWFRQRIAQLDDPDSVALVRAITAAAAAVRPAPPRLYDQRAEPQRQHLLRRLSVAVQEREIRADVDLDAATDAILGAVLLWNLGQGLVKGHERANNIIDILVDGMGGGGPVTRARR